nr:uncharacterized LOC105372440 homolog isoform X4 [Chlorocebus sabaeus]
MVVAVWGIWCSFKLRITHHAHPGAEGPDHPLVYGRAPALCLISQELLLLLGDLIQPDKNVTLAMAVFTILTSIYFFNKAQQ